MHYQVVLSENSRTWLKDDSKGRGSIRYIDTAEGKRVRIDNFLIPLSEISKRVGDKIRLCYYGGSPKPEFRVNSAEYQPVDGKPDSARHIPHEKYHDNILTEGRAIDIAKVPYSRSDISLSKRKISPMPEVPFDSFKVFVDLL